MDKWDLLHKLLCHRKIIAGTGCWEWSMGRNPDGYGQIKVDKRMHNVHRVSAVVFLDFASLQSPQKVLHHCDNPPCFNPDHLYIGTQIDNMRDRKERGRQWQRKKTHCAKGHPLSGENLYINPKGYRHCKECARVTAREYARIIRSTPEGLRKQAECARLYRMRKRERRAD